MAAVCIYIYLSVDVVNRTGGNLPVQGPDHQPHQDVEQQVGDGDPVLYMNSFIYCWWLILATHAPIRVNTK